jgi:hypothetical protein
VELLRLSSPTFDFWVEVRVLNRDDRWLATAIIGGDPEIGLAHSRDRAIAASLESLGSAAVAELMASPST